MTANIPRANYQIVQADLDFVFLVDLNLGGWCSVTNDAERVCREVFEIIGDKRIIYRDSMGQWDEMVHDNGVFKHFAPYIDVPGDD